MLVASVKEFGSACAAAALAESVVMHSLWRLDSRGAFARKYLACLVEFRWPSVVFVPTRIPYHPRR